ncbi:hypothetical protein Acsp05_74220 [Actinokineospora sp. NBRC 105648]|nr:hypothetical protein Acsp05_74220 [Actinokineospora sp. NBRC 105648]
MGTVVGLTFLFGFGNVFDLALRSGAPVWVAPLVAPAIDLSVLGLLLAVRYLALAGVPDVQLRSARRLRVFASLVTLALNVAGPIAGGEHSRLLATPTVSKLPDHALTWEDASFPRSAWLVGARRCGLRPVVASCDPPGDPTRSSSYFTSVWAKCRYGQ